MTNEKEDDKEYHKMVRYLQTQTNIKQEEINRLEINSPHSFFFSKYGKPSHPFGQQFASTWTGNIICTQQEWHELLLEYVKDIIQNKYILAISETCPNNVGVRVFFELDYRSYVRLPHEDEQLKHCQMMVQLIKETFPDEKNTTCKIARCQSKLKENPQNPGKPKLALGLHVVFPFIIAQTWQLRQLMLTLDHRITAENPFFANTVDPATAKVESANLRLLYSYRLDKCKGCFDERVKLSTDPSTIKNSASKYIDPNIKTNQEWMNYNTHNNTKKNNKKTSGDASESDSDFEINHEITTNKEINKEIEITCKKPGCYNGRTTVCVSIYEPWIEIEQDGHMYQPDLPLDDDEKKEWILEMSLVPPLHAKLSIYKPSKDAIMDVKEPFFRNPLSFPQNKKEATKLKQSIKCGLPWDKYAEIYRYTNSIIQNFDTPFQQLLTNTIFFDKRTSRLIVGVRGNNSKLCLCNGFRNKKNNHENFEYLSHQSNHIQFHMLLGQHKIQLACTDEPCKKFYKELYQTIKKQPIQLEPLQLQFLNHVQKEIPASCLHPLLDILGLESKKRWVITPNHLSHSVKLREKLPNGDSKLVDLVYDNRIGMRVPPEALTIDILSKKPKIEDLNPNYFFEDTTTHLNKQKPKNKTKLYDQDLDDYEALLKNNGLL